MLVCKGQVWKLLLNARDHRSLRRYCLRNRHASMMDIATWAREYFGKSLSLNTVRRCIKCNLKLYSAKRKAFHIFFVETPQSSLGPKSSEMVRKWKHVLWSHFSLFFGKNGCRILRAKNEKDHPDCYQRKVQIPASVMVWGCISDHAMGDLHICEGTIDAETYVGILERHMLPSRGWLFPRTLFQQDNARLHSAQVTTAWLCRCSVCVFDWSACSPDLSPIENVWRILKRRIRQWRPRTFEQLKFCIHLEWAKILLAKLQQLISSVPKWLQSIIQRKGDVTQWETCLCLAGIDF